MSDYSIGSNKLPGLGKMVEEAGELLTVLGKLIAVDGGSEYWENRNLYNDLEEELGDMLASIEFFLSCNEDIVSPKWIGKRREEKVRLYREWRANGEG